MNPTHSPAPYTRGAALSAILHERIAIIDGAMGTMVQRYKLGEAQYRGDRFKDWTGKDLKGNNEVLLLTQPHVIREIHAQYLEAGADIIETNTFNAQAVSLADYNMSNLAYEMNIAAAKCARAAVDEFKLKHPDRANAGGPYVAGAIGPMNKTLSLSPDVNNPAFRAVTFDELRIAYKQQAEALIDGGADILMVETVFDTLNAKAALFAIQQAYEEKGVELPIMVSGTITDASGRTLSGQTPEAFLVSISHMPLLSVGFNCALGPVQLKPHLQAINGKSNFFVSAHPNAGLPNEFGEYDLDPVTMAQQVKPYIDDGLVNILGGCCGTTPEHIAEMAKLLKS